MTSGPPITAHLGRDLEVRDGSVVDGEAALLLVELQQPVHAAVLLELVRLRQHKHHPQLVNLDIGLVQFIVSRSYKYFYLANNYFSYAYS